MGIEATDQPPRSLWDSSTGEAYSRLYLAFQKVCFNCKLRFSTDFHYCPFCGARLLWVVADSYGEGEL